MLTPWYVTGFCDGEANFTYSKAGGTFNLYFSIREKKGNVQIIQKIQEFFDSVGTIYRNKENLADKKTGAHQQSTVFFRVTRSAELIKIIEHFDKYPLQSRKKEGYLLWRQMVLHKIENYRNIDYALLEKLAGQLAALKGAWRTSATGRE